MERIIHGHYADPSSTRDIVGITPSQFETIIVALQQWHKALEAIATANDDELEAIAELSKIGGFIPEEMNRDNLKTALAKTEALVVEQYRNTYDILAAINQPYPGAEY